METTDKSFEQLLLGFGLHSMPAHLLHCKRVFLFMFQVLLKVEESVKEDVCHLTALQVQKCDLSCIEKERR